MLCGANDVDLQDQIQLKCPNLSHFELVRTITYYQIWTGVQNTLVKILIVMGAIDLDLQGKI